MAAQSLVSLKLETAEYESKIKHAQQGLLAMEKECRSVNGILINLDKSQLDYVRSLGQMETKSQTAKGRVSELTNSFTELRAQYNRLTDEEKKGDYGRALNKSLDELKTRINDAKGELKSIEGEIKGGGNALEELAGKFGLNIKQLVGWGAAIGAAKAALEVAKDTFFASESNLDDWNRVVYSAESTWDAFLTSLNTGDIGGFLQRIDEIKKAAADAYNKLDRLSTQKAINTPAIKRQEAENERFRSMLRIGRHIAPNDGRTPSMKEGQLLTDAQMRTVATQLKNGMATLNKYVRDEIKQTTKAIDALYKEQSLKLGMSEAEFRAGTANMDVFGTKLQGYRKYLEWERGRNATLALANSGHNVPNSSAAFLQGKNPFSEYKGWGIFKDDGELFTKIIDLINQRSSLQSQNYGNIARSYRGINRVEGVTVGPHKDRKSSTKSKANVTLDLLGIQPGMPADGAIEPRFKYTMNGVEDYISAIKKYLGHADLWSDTYKSLEANIIDATSFKELFSTALQEGIDFASLNADPKELWEKILDNKNIPDEVWEDLAKTISEKMGGEGITFDSNTGKVGKGKKKEKDKKDPIETANKLMSGVSQTLSGIQQMGLKIPEGLQKTINTIQGAISVIQGISTIIEVIQGSSTNLNTIATDANTAAIAALTAAISTNTFSNFFPFANGGLAHAANGFVGGNHYSGDNLPIMVNSGELILNKAQQGNLASQLEQNNQTFAAQPYLHSEIIYLGINNVLARMGKGELVTTSMLKKMR